MLLKAQKIALVAILGISMATSAFVQPVSAVDPVCPTDNKVTLSSPITVFNGIATANFSVAPGCEDLVVHMVTYQPSGTTAFPQSQFDLTGSTFDAGSGFLLRTAVPSCNFHVDIFTGAALDILTSAGQYGANLISTFNGTACDSNNQPVCPPNTGSIINSSLVLENGVATGIFSIAPGCEDIPVSLVSYKANAPTFQLPQTLFDSVTGTFDAGGPYTLQVDVEDCYYQIDLVFGPVIEVLSETAFYGNKKVQAQNGGTQACDVQGPQVAMVTVNKVVVNDNGGTAQASNFTLKVGDTTVTNGATTAFNAGTYTVSETGGPSGYTATFSGDCNAQGQITLSANQSYTCTITNNDNPPPAGSGPTLSMITVNKVVVNDNGGTAQASDFTLKVGDTTVTNGIGSTFNPGTYTISETGPAGYTATFSGACNGQAFVTLVGGENYVCTITNNDNPPPAGSGPTLSMLTVTKVVVNNNSGISAVADFILKVGETIVTSGAQTTFAPGTYTISESGPSGYSATFSGACNSSGQVVLVGGEVYTCTITNDDNAPASTGGGGGGGGGGGATGVLPVNNSVTPPVVDNPGIVLGETLPPADMGGVSETPVGGVAAGSPVSNAFFLGLLLMIVGIVGTAMTHKPEPML